VSSATGLSKVGKLVGMVPGAFDVPNWSLIKAGMAPKRYFEEGSKMLDEDTLENRFNFGMHVAGPVADLGALFGEGPIFEAIRPRVKIGNNMITSRQFGHELESRILPKTPKGDPGGVTLIKVSKVVDKTKPIGQGTYQLGRLERHPLHAPTSSSLTMDPNLLDEMRLHLHLRGLKGGIGRQWPYHKLDKVQYEIN
jgi:hypothetical protein